VFFRRQIELGAVPLLGEPTVSKGEPMSVKSAVPSILSPEYDANTTRVFEMLREDHPLHYDDSIEAWLVSRHADIKELFRHPEITTDNYKWQFEGVPSRVILEMDGKEHTAHRRMLNPFFKGAGLESFVPVIEQTIRANLAPIMERAAANASQALLDEVREREGAAVASGERSVARFDLAREFAHNYPISVIREMLGVPDEDHERVKEWYLATGSTISNLDHSEDPVERTKRTRQEEADYFKPLIAARRTGDGQDLISLLAQAEMEGEPLDENVIIAFISLLLIAGGETTDTGTRNLFRHLVMHPEQLKAVYEDRKLIDDAIAESLRFTPPVQIILRVPAADVEISGGTVKKGTTVALMLAAGNRDPRKFDHPDRFDIFRQDNSTAKAFRASADHVTFGDGRHFCAGAMLAQVEMTIAANMVLDEMSGPPWFPEGFEPEEHGVWFRGPDELPLEFELAAKDQQAS
jgi:cytochrome P450